MLSAIGLERFAEKAHSWPQVAFALGAVAGSFVSTFLSGVSYTALVSNGAMSLFSPVRSMLGGALLVFGARLASGCTSGHGISGMGQLGVASLLSTAAMFAGGMLTAVVA
eukprot:TRINITY_DN3324_c0_g1_i1.p2 TRINITY_DN3324_c0_g1~~TRINITY_DN3324_c0_g1_i1.p2  ORF type:complete len:110 (-),score=26.10 TRINITY_DN3324_c0_g1_i1:113-442(-)